MTTQTTPPDWDALRRAAAALIQTSGDPLARDFAARTVAALDYYDVKMPAIGPDGRRGSWVRCQSGGRFYPLDPRPSEILLPDIVWGLSHQNRYGGHTDRPYSVLSHLMLVDDIVRWLALGNDGFPRLSNAEERLARQDALGHDWTEAYVDDVRNPLKPYLWGYKPIERGVALTLGERFGLGTRLADLSPIVRRADILAVAVEAAVLCKGPNDWDIPPDPGGFLVVDETPLEARMRYRMVLAEVFPTDMIAAEFRV